MAKEAKKLDDLFHDTLKDIYFAEKKILSTLPKMAKAAQNEELKASNEELQRSTRGYSEEEWAQGKADLRAKGIFDADNAFTEFGQKQREEIEAQTDAAAAAPYEHLGPERTARLIELVRPWARSITKQTFG